MSSDFPACLDRFETWLSTSLPALHATLRPGASQLELNELETLIGTALPEDFRALYAWHDGQEWLDARPNVAGLFAGEEFLTLAEVSSDWKVWRDIFEKHPSLDIGEHVSVPPGHIKTQYINLGWVPVAGRGTGNKIGIDLAPGAEGQHGQFVNFGRDQYTKFVIAASLSEFVCQYVERCERGDVSLVDWLYDGDD